LWRQEPTDEDQWRKAKNNQAARRTFTGDERHPNGVHEEPWQAEQQPPGVQDGKVEELVTAGLSPNYLNGCEDQKRDRHHDESHEYSMTQE
jgi:hypothetical protein